MSITSHISRRSGSLCRIAPLRSGFSAVAHQRAAVAVAVSHKVELVHEGKSTILDVPEGENILEVALAQGLDLPHDCKLGVCMTCPAKMISGKVDQSASMLNDDITEKGFALLCVAQPTTDCKIQTIPEDELLEQQFGM